MMAYYFSLQYSAIQKTILRHDRLWSIAGMSQMLSELNEIKFREIAIAKAGTILVAGGGKFTAKFEGEAAAIDAKDAKEKIMAIISKTLPMLEFQVSKIVTASSLKDAKSLNNLDGKDYPGLIHELDEQKRCFRGYGLTFNPHLKVCEECGEYPATDSIYVRTEVTDNSKHEYKEISVCAVCKSAKNAAEINLTKFSKEEEQDNLTTLKKIYRKFIESLGNKQQDNLKIPTNFEDLFPDGRANGDTGKQKSRIAVWASDINGMGDKVTVWLNQEEDKLFDTFEKVKEINIEFVSKALIETFKDVEFIEKKRGAGDKNQYIPFRLIVAGGDDLCVVMIDKYILKFVSKLDKSLQDARNDLENGHPLNIQWLQENYNKNPSKDSKGNNIKKSFRPHRYGGSFVVTPIHTPFKKIHSVAEDLMGKAKNKTCRMENSVNWMVMSADEDTVSETLLKFEKPLFINSKPDFDEEKCPEDNSISESGAYLTFCDYMEMAEKYKKLSGSHIQQIISKIIECGEYTDASERLEKWLKRLPESARKDSVISLLLKDVNLRTDGMLNNRRISTLLELMSI